MPRKPKPKERIIPIRMETDEDSVQKKQQNEKEAAEPTTSKKQVLPVPMEAEEPSEQNQVEETFSKRCILDTSNSSDESLENSSENTLNDSLLKRTLPMHNVKERIILVVDSAEDENFTPFRSQNAQLNKPLEMLKRAVEIFLHNKQLINKKHEYALAVLNTNNVVWLVDFTTNIKDIVNALHQINSCETEDIFQLNSLFDLIVQNVAVPGLVEQEDLILPPLYIIRTILLYGRSYTMPKLFHTEEIDHLLESPYFTLDVLMTHEPVDNNNNCNKIFNVLQNLDKKGFSYFFPIARNGKALFGSMGKLLGHPLQRAPQQIANYCIRVTQ